MRNLMILNLILINLAFAGPTDTWLYTILNPPTSTSVDCVLYYFMDYSEIGRSLRNRDFQKGFYSVFNLSDSIRFTADNLGFFHTDNDRILEVIQDTVYVNYFETIGFSNFPLTPDTTPSNDYEIVNKKYVDDAITSMPSSYQDTTVVTHSFTPGKLLSYIVPLTSWGLSSNVIENSSGDCILGIALAGNKILTRGIYTTTGLTKGAAYYVGGTGGLITTTQPSTTGLIVRIIGRAKSTTQLDFNPSHDWAEIK